VGAHRGQHLAAVNFWTKCPEKARACNEVPCIGCKAPNLTEGPATTLRLRLVWLAMRAERQAGYSRNWSARVGDGPFGQRRTNYWPKIISNGETQVTAGSWMLLHFGQFKTWVPVSLLPSAERHNETDISHELMQEWPGLQ
jgi:hypothetical protein